MHRRHLLVGLFLALSSVIALAQTPTSFVGTSTNSNAPALSAAALNAAFGSKANAVGGILTNPTLAGGTVSNTDVTGALVTIRGTSLNLASAIAGAFGGPTYLQQVAQRVSNVTYGTGQVVGVAMAFNASARTPLYSGNITSLVINLPDQQTPTLDVWVFNANPNTSGITDGQAVTLSTADAAKRINVIQISNCTGTQTICQSQQEPLGFQLTSSTVLYLLIVARNSFTPSNLPVGAPAWNVTLATQQN